MNRNKTFFRSVCALAVPVALQSMLQASFSIADQIMIGQLGTVSVAGVGLAGKFTSIFSVLVAAMGTVAGIMLSQYLGQEKRQEVRRSFWLNLAAAVGLAGGFAALCLLLPSQIMGLYSRDGATIQAAADYLSIVALSFLPMAGATLMATLFRCMERASLPLFASVAAAVLNTLLNYILIFGKLGVAPMGVQGAAVATVISQWVNCLIMLAMLLRRRSWLARPAAGEEKNPFRWGQYAAMLLPILACEGLWSLGENVYGAIYGHLGTDACAAMTLINPIQSLMIGTLCGLSQAAGVLVGKLLGAEDYDGAYSASKKLVRYGFLGAALLSLLILLTASFYVQIYRVEPAVRQLTRQILVAYALVAPFKVANMILGGGVIRSGGKTNYLMWIDLTGTWVFGVPLGLLSAFVLKLSIPYVYFILSLEECVRFALSLAVFRSRRWMRSLA